MSMFRRSIVLSLVALTGCSVQGDDATPQPSAIDDPSDPSATEIVDTPSAGSLADVDDASNPDSVIDPLADNIPDDDLAAVDAELADTDGVLPDDDDGDAEDDALTEGVLGADAVDALDADTADLAAGIDDDLAAEPASPDDVATAQLSSDKPVDELDDTAPAAGIEGAGDATDVESNALAAAQTKIPSKIRYVLVIVKENHTFDNYFTGFPGAASSKHAYKYNKKHHKRIRFLRPLAPPNTLKSSPGHSHTKALAAYRSGHMDGFSVNPGSTPYIRYTKSQIPSYWKYASEFVLADNLFSTTLGPSSPGHEVFWFSRSTTLDNPKCGLPGGTGCGHGCTGTHLTATTFNPTTGTTRSVKPCFDLPSLPDHLPAGFTWFDYGGQMAKQIKSQQHVSEKAHYASTGQLLSDVKHGKLHNLMIAHVSSGALSEHPPEGVCEGERFTVDVVNAAMKLPEWKQMAIIVTWDDWGGFYDHVRPHVERARNTKIFGPGMRLPLLVISPYAKKGVVLHTRTEQASVPRLVEELWGMKMMSKSNAHARDGRAGSLLGAFDFKQAPRPPIELARRSCPGD